MKNRVLAVVSAAAVALVVSLVAINRATAEKALVYKSPTCGCCSAWVDHLREQGFDVEARDVADVAQYKLEHGVPYDLGSCHTAVIGGYVIEGHVPAANIRRLLAERPDIAGLAVPGMPSGSPGMPGPAQSYAVIAFDRDGNQQVYARH